MNPDLDLGQLLDELGEALAEPLRARGLHLDSWDRRLDLGELCLAYDLDLDDLVGLVRRLRVPPAALAAQLPPSSARPHSRNFR